MILLRSIATVGGITMISRVLGFVRDILIAAALGAGMVADVFFVAFKLPNLFRRLFAEGAFSAAFVPIFTERLTSDGRDAARVFSEQAMAVLVVALLVFIVVMEASMPVVMMGFAPGFVAIPEKFDLLILLTRITFPYLLFISLVSLMAGVLNALGRFAAAAATPILLNLFLIGALLGLAPHLPTAGHALAWGVGAAGVAQFLWLLWRCARAGMALRMPRPRLTPPVRLLLKRILPVAIGAGLYQLNLLVDTIIASLLPSGTISFLFYADRVNQLPLGVVGVAVGTALLPMISRQLAAGDNAAARESQNRAIEFAMLLTLPAAAALMVIAGPVIHVLFERGAFGPEAAGATADVLAIFASGLPAYVLVKVLVPAYFARGDTATPIKIGAVAMAVNVVLSLILMWPLRHVGIAIAMAVSAWVNALLLGVMLSRRGHLEIDPRLKARLWRALAATLLMAAALAVGKSGLSEALSAGVGSGVLALVALVLGGLTLYLVMARLLGAATMAELRAAMRKQAA